MMWRAVRVLWWRDLVRFLRQPSRLAGAFMQPIILWLVIAGGLRSTFAFPGMPELDYLEYFFPGVLVMMALFTAIFSTMSLIEDRHAGFMQTALVGPGTRSCVALGKMLGGASLSLLQSFLFLILLPLAGFTLLSVDWLALLGMLALSGLAMTAAVRGYRMIITMLDLEQKSVKEIAKLTDFTESNVKVRAHRARDKMKKTLTTLAPQKYL